MERDKKKKLNALGYHADAPGRSYEGRMMGKREKKLSMRNMADLEDYSDVMCISQLGLQEACVMGC